MCCELLACISASPQQLLDTHAYPQAMDVSHVCKRPSTTCKQPFVNRAAVCCAGIYKPLSCRDRCCCMDGSGLFFHTSNLALPRSVFPLSLFYNYPLQGLEVTAGTECTRSSRPFMWRRRARSQPVRTRAHI